MTNLEHAEADTFYCFSRIMGFEGVRENFVPVLDSDSQWGISKTFIDYFRYKKSN